MLALIYCCTFLLPMFYLIEFPFVSKDDFAVLKFYLFIFTFIFHLLFFFVWKIAQHFSCVLSAILTWNANQQFFLSVEDKTKINRFKL